jgi:hypothetical protein
MLSGWPGRASALNRLGIRSCSLRPELAEPDRRLTYERSTGMIYSVSLGARSGL